MNVIGYVRVSTDEQERTGSVPFGYALAPGGVKLLPARNEQAPIAEARALRAAGISLRAMAETLFERGHMNRTGSCFAPEQVKRMVAA